MINQGEENAFQKYYALKFAIRDKNVDTPQICFLRGDSRPPTMFKYNSEKDVFISNFSSKDYLDGLEAILSMIPTKYSSNTGV